MIIRGYIVLAAALTVLIAHTLLLPFIWFMPGVMSVMSLADKIDVSLIVAPLTSAYFLSVIRYGNDHAKIRLINPKDKVNILFAIVAFFAIVPFLLGLYYLVYARATNSLGGLTGNGGSEEQSAALKVGLSVLEVYFGGAFGYFVGSLFGAGKAGTGAAAQSGASASAASAPVVAQQPATVAAPVAPEQPATPAAPTLAKPATS